MHWYPHILYYLSVHVLFLDLYVTMPFQGEVVGNIVLKNVRQIKSYADMFQAIRGLTVQKIRKIRISGQKFLQNESFFFISLKRFDLNCMPRKDTTTTTAWHH